MSVTDTYVMNDAVYKTLENGAANAAFPALTTTMFTSAQIVDAFNRVQQEFLLETGAILTFTTITGSVGDNKYPTPVNSIRPRRVTWQDASDGQIRILTQCDTWQLDTGAIGWVANRDIPIAWWETTLDQQNIALALTPINDGTIGLLYVALAAALTGAGVNMTVPDDFTPYITWGVLADLLGSDGQAFDPARASYCRQRFEEGIELANLILGG